MTPSKIKINIYRSPIINYIIKVLFWLSLVLIPYDAIKIMPSVYKPICLIPATVLFLLLIPKIVQTKLEKKHLFLVFFVLMTFISTLYNDVFVLGNFKNFIDFFITQILFICSFMSLDYVFKIYSKTISTNDYINFFFKILAYAYVLTIIVTVIDILSIYGFLPRIFKQLILMIFGGNQDNRVTGTSFESSWLCVHLIIAFISFLYVYKQTKRKSFLILCIITPICFILTFSLQGFMFIAIYLVIYFFINFKKNIVLSFKILFSTVLLLLVLILIFNTVNIDAYYINRIKQLTSLSDLFRSDSSTFIRIGYPYLSIQMFFDNPIFGIGGGNFNEYLGDYIKEYFPWALNFYGSHNNEIYINVVNKTASTKCLYARLFCEFGLIAGILYFGFLVSCIKNRSGNKYTLILLLFAIIFPLQFDSLCYAVFIIIIAFYSNLDSKVNTNIKKY